MRHLQRGLVTTLTSLVLLGAVVVPAMAATGDYPVSESATPCVVNATSETAVRAMITPSRPVARDVAFNDSDPDALDSPLEPIRFPDETALWVASGVTAGALFSARSPGTIGEYSVLPFTGIDRADAAVSDSIVRLYCGLLDRRPSAFELEYWAGRYWAGLPLVTIAEAFTHSSEFVQRHGVVSDRDLVAILYADVLDRRPGGDGADAMLAAAGSGPLARGALIATFTESAEYVARTGTALPSKPPLPYPDVGSGRRIIYSNLGGRIWLIDASGELVKTHQVSGRRGVPEHGRYRVYSMSRYAWAPHDGITMEYMVRFARGEWPYGFHSIPVHPDETPLQTPAQLGTLRSGGCVRQLWDDAAAVFDWATIGTRVIVIP